MKYVLYREIYLDTGECFHYPLPQAKRFETFPMDIEEEIYI